MSAQHPFVLLVELVLVGIVVRVFERHGSSPSGNPGLLKSSRRLRAPA